jgi:hypothetical protein
VRLRLGFDRTGQFNFTVHPMLEYSPAEVLPLVRLLAAMTAPNLATVVLEGGRLNTPAALAEEPLVEQAFVHLVEGIARL